ncbi:MAG: MFS transporter [Acetivibrionales bacterium]|jgi:MFS family permease
MGPLSNMLKVRKNDLPLLYTVYFSFFTSGMMSTLIGSLLPYMKSEYELSYVLGGAVLSAHQIGNFTALILAGFLPYLLGRKKSTLVLSSGIIIGFTMMTLTGNPLTLIIAFVLTGVGRGTRSNITNVLISEITENKTAGLNLLHGSFAIGAFLAPLVALLTTSIRGALAACRISPDCFGTVRSSCDWPVDDQQYSDPARERNKTGFSHRFFLLDQYGDSVLLPLYRGFGDWLAGHLFPRYRPS